MTGDESAGVLNAQSALQRRLRQVAQEDDRRQDQPQRHQVIRPEAEVKDRIKKLVGINGKRSPDSFHKELGKIMWDNCGMARSDKGLRKALARIPELHEEFWHNLRIVGGDDELNQALEKANRISDFLELAQLMCLDGLNRTESCGGHFRVESQTAEGEAKRDDAHFSYTAAWEWKGPGQAPALHKEPLTFKYIPLSQRSYK